MSKLLIHEPPLQVLPSLAEAIGLNEAIVIQQLHYWLQLPKGGREQGGHKWIFNTYEEWHEQFPFWSVSTIQRIFANLEKDKLIISEQLDKKSHDMRKFYRLDYAELQKMERVKMTSSEDSKMTSSNVPHKHDVKRNTKTTAKTTAKTTYKRGDLVDGMKELSQMPGVKKSIRLDYIASRIATQLHINPSGRKWEDFMRFADDREQKEKQKLDTFIKWLVSQKGFDLSYWPPDKMRQHWPRAFSEPIARQPKGFDAVQKWAEKAGIEDG